MYTTVFPYLLGAILAWITVRPSRELSPGSELRFLRMIMVGVAVGFVGFPASTGDLAGVWYELGAMLVFALMLLGTRVSMGLLAATYFVHGLWDLAFLVGLVPVDKPTWVTELCVPYDWLLAAYISYLLLKLRRAEPAAAEPAVSP